MKLHNMIGKTVAICVLAGTIAAGCKKNFFDIPDQNGLDDIRMWNDPGAVGLYLNKGYDLVIPTWPVPNGIHNSSDELNSANQDFLYGRFTDNSIADIGTGNKIDANKYFDIRRCNTAIDGMNGGTIDSLTKVRLKGQFFFLRAFVYFNLVRLYGGVPLIYHAQSPNDESLSVPRSKTSVCIDSIARDLDSATAYLPVSWPAVDRGRVPKAAALALKGKVLLYWASPQFNPANDITRWERAYTACKMAYDSCVIQGYALYSRYESIFSDESSGNKEPILIKVYDPNIPERGTNTEHITRPRSETTTQGGGGSNQPTLNLVRAYTMKDGVPISQSALYNETTYWLNRDPRFNASIAYNGCVWPLSSIAGRKQWCYTGVPEEAGAVSSTGFYCRKICNPTITAAKTQYINASGGGSGMDWIEMRFAEVIINLAECANETGRMTEAKDMIRRIRIRAGIEAGTGGNDYGLGLANGIGDMRDLIFNERRVEFAMEGKRYHDLRRMRRFGDLNATTRLGLDIVARPPYTAGIRVAKPDPTRIYLDSVYPSGIRPRDTANLNDPVVYQRIFSVIEKSLDTQPISIPDNYYFYPFNRFFMQSSFLLEQTQGWPGGSFDPLQ